MSIILVKAQVLFLLVLGVESFTMHGRVLRQGLRQQRWTSFSCRSGLPNLSHAYNQRQQLKFSPNQKYPVLSMSTTSGGHTPYYITTPIYYVNARPHIGHGYTSVACDVIARFRRMDGYDVRFVSGTDEHGQKVATSAATLGYSSPQEFADDISASFRELLNVLLVDVDDFVRTTENRHKTAAQRLWSRLEAGGDIYLGSYDGWYSVRDECFYGEGELVAKDSPSLNPSTTASPSDILASTSSEPAGGKAEGKEGTGEATEAGEAGKEGKEGEGGDGSDPHPHPHGRPGQQNPYGLPPHHSLTRDQIQSAYCAPTGAPIEFVSEPSYFFRLSKYTQPLLKLLDTYPNMVGPESRKNEIISFIQSEESLRDLSISRVAFDWGVPVPVSTKSQPRQSQQQQQSAVDSNSNNSDGGGEISGNSGNSGGGGGDQSYRHVMYVWLDALTNYLTALGYGDGDIDTDGNRVGDSDGDGDGDGGPSASTAPLFQRHWSVDGDQTTGIGDSDSDSSSSSKSSSTGSSPTDGLVFKVNPNVCHVVGKDILRFHAVYWPAFLMSANLPLPGSVFAHGWWTKDGQKISKSLGNVIDPFELVDKYGVDQVRFFLSVEVPFGNDGDFTHDSMMKRANGNLANEVGNLCQRTLSMGFKNFKSESHLSLYPPTTMAMAASGSSDSDSEGEGSGVGVGVGGKGLVPPVSGAFVLGLVETMEKWDREVLGRVYSRDSSSSSSSSGSSTNAYDLSPLEECDWDILWHGKEGKDGNRGGKGGGEEDGSDGGKVNPQQLALLSGSNGSDGGGSSDGLKGKIELYLHSYYEQYGPIADTTTTATDTGVDASETETAETVAVVPREQWVAGKLGQAYHHLHLLYAPTIALRRSRHFLGVPTHLDYHLQNENEEKNTDKENHNGDGDSGSSGSAGSAGSVGSFGGSGGNSRNRLSLHRYASEVMEVAKIANRYLEDQAPWSLRKTDLVRMNEVLYTTLEAIRRIAILLQPITPVGAEKMLQQLGASSSGNGPIPFDALFYTTGSSSSDSSSSSRSGSSSDSSGSDFPRYVPLGLKLAKPTPVFPRLEFEDEE